jgi:hypothetical protein
MKTTYLIATLAAASLPLAAVAEDSGKTDTPTQKQEQTSGMMGMKGMMGKGQMMSAWREQDAELDKLVAEMNGATPEKKLDAVAAVVTKLVEQRKAMRDQMQSMMSANEKDAMAMCRMMMGMNTPSESGHSHH